MFSKELQSAKLIWFSITDKLTLGQLKVYNNFREGTFDLIRETTLEKIHYVFYFKKEIDFAHPPLTKSVINIHLYREAFIGLVKKYTTFGLLITTTSRRKIYHLLPVNMQL